VILSGLVQFLTLKQSLYYLFPGETSLEAEDFDDIVLIGDCVNQLWVESKEGEDVMPEWQQETDLQDALRRVSKQVPREPTNNQLACLNIWQPLTSMCTMFGSTRSWFHALTVYQRAALWMQRLSGKPQEIVKATCRDPRIPEQNPMNLILPAYDTMWRVVMRCFIEIRHRAAPNSREWSGIMANYLKELENPQCNPGKTLWTPAPKSGVTALDIVKEALRLYPPTRCVHRFINEEILVADVQKCQRFSILAGEESLVFSPEH
jgi:hypothetical protein